MMLWFSLGAPSVYFGLGSVMALHAHRAFSDGLEWHDWFWVACCWPQAFFYRNLEL